MSLMDLYPELWKNSPEFVALQEALDPEAERLLDAAESARAQLVLSSATWGLKYWEMALGLSVDETKYPVYRRERVSAKLRGASVTTEAMIQNVAKAFDGGKVHVVVDAAAYTVTIHFDDTYGVPDNLNDLTQALKEIMPAHLSWAYQYQYNTWDDTALHTWDQVGQRTWDQVLGEEWK